MSDQPKRIYCSGPLFNEHERDEMAQIARALEDDGFAVFLPHRDGLEFLPLAQMLMAQGLDEARANALWDKAVFALDVYQVVEACDGLALNLNGRVPDEGAVAEAALAYAAGKAVAAYKDDVRSLYFGKDNPLIAGLFDWRVCGGMRTLCASLRAALEQPRPQTPPALPALDLGRRLWQAKNADDGFVSLLNVLREAS